MYKLRHKLRNGQIIPFTNKILVSSKSLSQIKFFFFFSF